jgi:hypothetical protein
MILKCLASARDKRSWPRILRIFTDQMQKHSSVRSVAWFSAFGLRWGFFTYTLTDFENHLPGFLVGVDYDVIAMQHFAV